ncbi:hypothetical protein EGW08_003179 [Elysia chlorotica]|uniref:TIR domain-containing protein n=1 Tax=Elysia chlorotica TaxID=188477 RepID=A0A433U5V9_ELYCH|nr:hypothetical protein EGW08_003179 [Elysia chlorotica]
MNMATGGVDEIETDAVREDLHEQEGFSSHSAKEYKKYIKYMPSELRHDNFDILLLYSREDYREVKKFQRRIQRDCSLIEGEEIRNPVVKLEDEYVQLHDNPTNALDFAYKKAVCVFLFVTKTFCSQDLALFKGHACLMNALDNKKWCVIPVQTEDRETRNKKRYSLPMMLSALQAINYWDKNFYKETVERILDARMHYMTDMNKELDSEREEYFNTHKTELMSIFSRQMQRMGHNLAASRLKYPVKEQGEPLKQNSSKMKESDCVGESKSEYTSLGYGSDLKSNPDGHYHPNVRTYGSNPAFTHSETGANLGHTDQRRYPSGHNEEYFSNLQDIAHVLPGPAHLASSASSSCQSLVYLPSPESAPVSTVVHAPSSNSSFDGRDTLPQDSQQNLTFEHPTSDHQSSSETCGPMDSSNRQAFVTTSASSSSNPTQSPNPSTHENIQRSDTVRGDGNAVHHHHHHYHKHFQIETVEYMAAGENPKIHVVTVSGPEHSHDSDGDGNEQNGGGGNNHATNTFHSEETELKTTRASSSGSTNLNYYEAHPGEEETVIKLPVKETPPPSYGAAMGFPELTDPNTSVLFKAKN